jgi:hypothetical protein
MVAVVKKYVASDGKEFDTREEAVAHDEGHKFDALIGLTEEDIADVLAGKSREVGDVIEKLAASVARKRRKDGDLKRNVKPRGAPPSATEAKAA